MNKKAFITIVVTLVMLLSIYKIITIIISNTVDDANFKSVELYANSIKYSYITYLYKHELTEGIVSMDDLDIKNNTKVTCEKINIDNKGNVELRGCLVESYKTKYKYVNNKVGRE